MREFRQFDRTSSCSTQSVYFILVIVALATYLNSVHGIQFPPDQHWFCAIATTVLWSATLSSTLLILSMTFDRVYSILRPHKAASFNTVKRAKITIILIVISSCIFNIPYLFTLTNNGPQCVMDLSEFVNRFYFWLACVVQFVIPFITLLSMNSIMIHTLRTRFRSKSNIFKGKNQEHIEAQTPQTKNQEKQIYVILLLVAFSFFILITPLYAFNIYVQVFDYTNSAKHFAGFYIFYQIIHKMYFTNNAINFFLYVISGQKFRNDLLKLFNGKLVILLFPIPLFQNQKFEIQGDTEYLIADLLELAYLSKCMQEPQGTNLCKF